MPFDRNAEFLKRQLRMVACTRWFEDARISLREQSGKQHSGLYLRASHRHFVVNAAQFSAMDFERRKIFVARQNLRAHFAQRSQNAFHRTLVQRAVAGNFRVEILSRKNSREQPDGSPGISSIQRATAAF